MSTTREPYIELLRGKGGWRWHVKGGNGELIVTSQRYYNKYSARRSAVRLAELNGMDVKLSRERKV